MVLENMKLFKEKQTDGWTTIQISDGQIVLSWPSFGQVSYTLNKCMHVYMCIRQAIFILSVHFPEIINIS